MKRILIFLCLLSFLCISSYAFNIENDFKTMRLECRNRNEWRNKLNYYIKSNNLTKDSMICSLMVIGKKIEPDVNLWAEAFFKDKKFKIWLESLSLLGNEDAINAYRKLLRVKDNNITQSYSATLLFDISVPWYPLCDTIIRDTINISDITRWDLYEGYLKRFVLDKTNDPLVKDSAMTLLCYALKSERDPYNSIYADSLLSFLSPEYRYSKERRKVNIKIASHEKLDIIKQKSKGEFHEIIMRTKDVLSIPETKLHQSERFKECLGD